MYLQNAVMLLVRPGRAWHTIAAENMGLGRRLVTHTMLLALIPAIAWYFGATEQGWVIGSGERQYMTPDSALPICTLFFLAMIAGVVFVGYMIHWMAQTYEGESSLAKGVAIVTYTATPFFIGGILGLYPILWLDILIGVLVGCYAVYLLYIGVPVVMKVSPERGFLFASAVIAVALVGFVAVLGATVILWDFGFEPVYTD